MTEGVNATTKSERSIADSAPETGIACTNTVDRTMAALGRLYGVESHFKSSLDVKGGGMLLAIPFLDDNSAFDGIYEYFVQPKGYYSLIHIFLYLHLMSLLRVKKSRAK